MISPPVRMSLVQASITCGWVSWFNEEQLHSELDDRSPTKWEPSTVATLTPAVA
jgi:hypothetical protein